MVKTVNIMYILPQLKKIKYLNEQTKKQTS